MKNKRKKKSKQNINKILNGRHQLWLDVGCGTNKQDGCIGMDIKKFPGVDIVHDWERMPWPFQKETFTRVLLIHVMEHVKPWLQVDLMNEIWRVLKPRGSLLMVMPYPGSHGHWQDPTHIKPWNESSAKYFDPEVPDLYKIYRPRPWEVEACVWHASQIIEIAMRKRPANYVAKNKPTEGKLLLPTKERLRA